MRDQYVYDEEAICSLLRLWRETLEGRSGTSAVVEDTDRLERSRIVAWGLSVFVSDSFMIDVKTRLPPYVGLHLLRRWSDGHSPILTLSEIRRANEGDGLNILALHHGWLENTAPDQVIAAQQKLAESFNAYHAGYKVKEFLHEVYGAESVRHYRNIGVLLRKEYADQPTPTPPPPPGREPRLVGITREEALSRPGTLAMGIFLYAPPRFGFTNGERDLLQQALDGRTDEELAQVLHVSLATVKKRWEAVYDRVADVVESLTLPTNVTIGRRGAEKRRRLLAYLREHPEELRP